jgi:double-stranded uracil-DNA glycosylase
MAVDLASVRRIESLPPIVSERSTVLILGSMPGEVSLKAGQYYAHQKNIFWRIMGELFGAGPSAPYERRIQILQSVGVALWDVLQACSRSGSLDASIREAVANDFVTFFAKHPNITPVFFNGIKAQKVFRRYVLPTLTKDRHTYTLLPSTSPAHAAIPREAKIQAWSVIVSATDAARN